MLRPHALWVFLPILLVLGFGAAGRHDPPLVDAAKRGDLAAMRTLLGQRVPVNAPAADGATALHWAAYRGDAAAVELLLSHGADIRTANRYGITPLAIACERGQATVVERLLKSGADANTTLAGGETVLMMAARTGSVDVIRALLAHGAHPNTKEQTREQTALMWAAARGNTDAIAALVEGGADLKARSTEAVIIGHDINHSQDLTSDRRAAFTPLLFAVRAGYVKAVEALLDRGAAVNDGVPNGPSALTLATHNAHYELASVLLDRGADPNGRLGPGLEANAGTRGRRTGPSAPLHALARNRMARSTFQAGVPPPVPTGNVNSLDLVKKLVARGADINLQDAQGNTALVVAGYPADPQLIRLLLDLGADPRIRSASGTTVLMRVTGTGTVSTVGDEEQAVETTKLLLSLPPDAVNINAVNDAGDTAMHGAAGRGVPEIVQMLVDKGANLDVKNTKGWTPLMKAHGDYGAGRIFRQPKTEALLLMLLQARGLSTHVPTDDEIREVLVSKGPSLTCPAAPKAASPDGQPVAVNFPLAKNVGGSGSVSVRCVPESGSKFPVGKTTITCTSSDSYQRKDRCAVLAYVTPAR